eukprot:CAMPEP_0114503504 /NCGR_PEP_ID=MMETSP0109-20121206/9683_1 /TAXON_ID=29199 /ORGANISM="Chlorarachnion reptans, Strain CCCM449" /LENGTH=280 /DNA_ID=CAMNT_0001681537 /DNA_START=58 /DNA_END=903 /DNA_ORIENTATION=+
MTRSNGKAPQLAPSEMVDGVPDPWEVTWHLALTTLGMTVVYVWIYRRTPLLGNTVPKEYRASFADNLFNIVYLPILSLYAIRASYTLGIAGAEARWRSTNFDSYWFLVLYISKNIMRTVSSIMLGDKKKGIWLIHLHHVVSIMCYSVGLFLGRLHFFGSLDGVCEFSIVFLNMKLLSRDFGLPRGTLYGLNMVLVTLTWILTRLLAFPLWLFVFYSDLYNYPFALEMVNSFELWVYPTTTIIIWCMSILWFIPIWNEMLEIFNDSSGVHKIKNHGREKTS